MDLIEIEYGSSSTNTTTADQKPSTKCRHWLMNTYDSVVNQIDLFVEDLIGYKSSSSSSSSKKSNYDDTTAVDVDVEWLQKKRAEVVNHVRQLEQKTSQHLMDNLAEFDRLVDLDEVELKKLLFGNCFCFVLQIKKKEAAETQQNQARNTNYYSGYGYQPFGFGRIAYPYDRNQTEPPKPKPPPKPQNLILVIHSFVEKHHIDYLEGLIEKKEDFQIIEIKDEAYIDMHKIHNAIDLKEVFQVISKEQHAEIEKIFVYRKNEKSYSSRDNLSLLLCGSVESPIHVESGAASNMNTPKQPPINVHLKGVEKVVLSDQLDAFFRPLENLTQLSILEAHVETSHAQTFRRLKRLETLSIHAAVEYPTVHELDETVFDTLTNLKHLLLQRMHLERINERMFVHLGSSLRELNLALNDIKDLADHTFKHLTNLERLWLQRNQLKAIRANTFSGLKQLKYLDLSYNEIVSIETGSFIHMPNLAVLYMVKNKIDVIPKSELPNQTQLTI